MQRWRCCGNSADPDQAPQEQSDMGLHCSLGITSKCIAFYGNSSLGRQVYLFWVSLNL